MITEEEVEVDTLVEVVDQLVEVVEVLVFVIVYTVQMQNILSLINLIEMDT